MCRPPVRCLLQLVFLAIFSHWSGPPQVGKQHRCVKCYSRIRLCFVSQKIWNHIVGLPPVQAPPADRKYRASLATTIEPCGASFRRLIAAALTSESRLLRAAVVRVLARASGAGWVVVSAVLTEGVFKLKLRGLDI